MKKIITLLAVLAVSCTMEEMPGTGDAGTCVTSITVSLPQTKVSVDETDGKCFWEEEDRIAVWDADASRYVEFTLTEGAGEAGAVFSTDETVTLTDGTDMVYPSSYAYSIAKDGELVMNVPNVLDHDSDSKVPVVLRGNVSLKGEVPSGIFSHELGIIKFTLHDVPAYAAGFVLKSESEALAGLFQDGSYVPSYSSKAIKFSFPYKTGYTADPKDSSNDIQLYSIAAHGSYLTRVYLIDGDGDEIEGSEKRIKQSWNDVSTDDFIAFPAIDFKKADLRKDYVKVCGIKWAKGNLQCYKDNGDAGFQNGWRIAPAQWHNLHYKEASTASEGKATAYTYSNDSNMFEHFNYGGIARQARFVSAGNYIVEPASGLDISGKVYSDVNATAEVTGNAAFKEIDTFADANHNELWGDIAYWASKGKYRLPKNTEMVKLHNVSDKLAGYYKTSDGSVVYGYLYRTPNPSRVSNNTNQEFTDADLESGLFLPKAGRRGATASASKTIINVMTQGMYRTSTYVKSVTNSDVLYYCSAYYSLGDAGKLADDNLKVEISSILNVGYANAHQAGHLIRPVLVETAE